LYFCVNLGRSNFQLDRLSPSTSSHTNMWLCKGPNQTFARVNQSAESCFARVFTCVVSLQDPKLERDANEEGNVDVTFAHHDRGVQTL
jgi:hypothetical protein